jgi:hypothetical protein
MRQTLRRLWQDAGGAGSGGVCADNHPSQFVVGRRDESALATPWKGSGSSQLYYVVASGPVFKYFAGRKADHLMASILSFDKAQVKGCRRQNAAHI